MKNRRLPLKTATSPSTNDTPTTSNEDKTNEIGEITYIYMTVSDKDAIIEKFHEIAQNEHIR